MTLAITPDFIDPIDPHSAYGRLLSHPRLRKLLDGALRAHRLQPADVDELRGQVLDALWRRRLDADPPDNLPRLLALARKVLEGRLVDFFRRRDVERARLADPPMPAREDGRRGAPAGQDQPNFVDEVAPPRSITPEDALRASEQLAFVQDMLDGGVLGPDDLEVLQAERAGEKTFEQLAAERGIKGATLRQRVHRLRETLAQEWARRNRAWNVRSTRLLLVMMLLLLLLATMALAVAGRREPPPAPPRRDRTSLPTLRGAAPEVPPAPPSTPSHAADKPG